MFHTYVGGAEHNYNILKRAEGHLRSINVNSRSFQGHTLTQLLNTSVADVLYLIWGHKTQL